MTFENVASEFVEKAMSLVSLNVNVMNSEGVIIASGDNDRIGHLHEGAILAIQRNDTVLLTESDIKNLKGTKEGINIPIRCRNNLVGVLGITGERNKILDYGQLLKMTIELYLENEILIEEQIKHRNFKDKLFLALLKDDLSDFNLDIVSTYSKKLRLSEIHNTIIIQIEESDFILCNNTKSKILKLIEPFNINSIINFVVNTDFDKMAIVITESYETKLANNTNKVITKIKEENKSNSLKIKKIAIGCPFSQRKGINKSYKTALNLLNTELTSSENIFWAKEQLVDVIINSNENFLERELLKKNWLTLCNNDIHYELRHTMNTYIESNCEAKLSSETLNIHRNTLDYRFEKIYKLTGLNPKIKKDLFILIISQKIYINS